MFSSVISHFIKWLYNISKVASITVYMQECSWMLEMLDWNSDRKTEINYYN